MLTFAIVLNVIVMGIGLYGYDFWSPMLRKAIVWYAVVSAVMCLLEMVDMVSNYLRS